VDRCPSSLARSCALLGAVVGDALGAATGMIVRGDGGSLASGLSERTTGSLALLWGSVRVGGGM
jgi:hypothetical protein